VRIGFIIIFILLFLKKKKAQTVPKMIATGYHEFKKIVFREYFTHIQKKTKTKTKPKKLNCKLYGLN